MAAPTKLISPKTFAERLCLSRSSIYRLMDDEPGFPRPVKIAVKRIAFVEAEAEAYIAGRIAARGDVAPASQASSVSRG
ncbi:helix-turn-helix transcriptional regulator [Methylobacterium iners]|uniref:helix-turn-helix transcriptional regulator n=1 Tax=Methylobacterium iners TaxID=418707 RepID=UPI0035A22F31